MINYPPRGLIVDLVTPLDREGGPDLKALAGLIGRIAGQASAWLVGGIKTGGGLDLTAKARLTLLETALSIRPEKGALFFEVTARTKEETLDLVRRAEALIRKGRAGVEVFFLLTPLVCHGNRDLPGFFQNLARSCARRFILANNPALVARHRARLRHRNIRTFILKRLAENEQFAGLDYEGDLSRALGYQRAVRGRTGFRFYDGSEESFLERPSSSGLFSCGALLLPQAWADVAASSLNLFDAQRIYPDHLNRIWRSGLEIRELLEAYRSDPPGLIKAALGMMGLAAEEPGPDAVEKEALAELKVALKNLQLI